MYVDCRFIQFSIYAEIRTYYRIFTKGLCKYFSFFFSKSFNYFCIHFELLLLQYSYSKYFSLKDNFSITIYYPNLFCLLSLNFMFISCCFYKFVSNLSLYIITPIYFNFYSSILLLFLQKKNVSNILFS